MKLDKYLTGRNIRRAAFAALVPCSPSLVTRWCDGTRTPTRAHLARIVALTDSIVGPEDFFDAAACARLDWRCQLRNWMRANNLTFIQTAARIGAHPKTLSHWMNRRRRPSMRAARRLIANTDPNILLEAFLYDDVADYDLSRGTAEGEAARPVRTPRQRSRRRVHPAAD